MEARSLERLNAEQRHAVEYGSSSGSGKRDGPLLIIAGAGSGKTSTLAYRVARLIADGADPGRILLMTFSRRAASEMSRRVARICAETLGAGTDAMTSALPWAGTFHAIGARLLRELAPRVGLDPEFSIHDRVDSSDLINLVRHELGFSRTETRFPGKGTCLAIYSRAVNSEAPLDAVLKAAFPWCTAHEKELSALFAAYVEAKQAQSVIDYDDLLLYWAGMLADAGIAAEIGGRFDHVLVDEYQDTNRLQAAILLALKPGGCGLTVVGDDAQSIYAFRAATVRNILEFPDQFDPPAGIVTLDRNYRSTRPILDAANGVISLAHERYTKDLWTERDGERPRLVSVRDEADQSHYIAEQVLENRETGMALKQQAVLFRTSHHAGPLEVELRRRNIPFVKFGGLKFLDSAHVKDMLAALRFLQNPLDRVVGFRLMLLLPGVGPASAQRALDRMAEAADPLAALAETAPPPRAGADWPDFVSMLRTICTARAGWPAELGLIRGWYEPHLARIYEDAESRRADLIQLENIAAGFSSRERFLTELALDPPGATSDEAGAPHLDEDYLILSTIHSAKGQEWRSVFVLNAVDGCIPSDLGTGETAEIEEERRLLYVAMTRAKDRLDLILPQRFYVHGQRAYGDRHVYAARTRFIPKQLLSHFETVTWPCAGMHEAAAQASPTDMRVDLGARMRGMWQ